LDIQKFELGLCTLSVYTYQSIVELHSTALSFVPGPMSSSNRIVTVIHVGWP